MRFSIDAIFLDSNSNVVALLKEFSPGKVSAFVAKAHQCLELSPGTIELTKTQLGDKLASEAVG